jgi:hypothetical protein
VGHVLLGIARLPGQQLSEQRLGSETAPVQLKLVQLDLLSPAPQ